MNRSHKLICPAPENSFQAEHAHLLTTSFEKLLGRPLITGDARALYHAPFPVLSHNTAADPILTYGNLATQSLWETDWDALTQMPSRLTAEPEERDARARLLSSIQANGFIDNYRGIRISRTGKRFYIEDAVIWTLIDAAGKVHGQAATFKKATPI